MTSKFVSLGDGAGHAAYASLELDGNVLVIVAHTAAGRKTVVRADLSTSSVLSSQAGEHAGDDEDRHRE